MGDAESCLLRQQTREVRKKPLINYRFLRAAANAEPRGPQAQRTSCAKRECGAFTQRVRERAGRQPPAGGTRHSRAERGRRRSHPRSRTRTTALLRSSQTKQGDGHQGEAAVSERFPQGHPEALTREEPRHAA
ncbi:SLC6A6 isoform 4 [Pan troglodytes]|uniref:Solute carrier family 6 member 6 n=3 Tax=Homininae TaxID=207598 RepID=A0A087WZ59_HUMAN|nr:solute carrier family 6 member 6 [Homo sapiens]KAI2528393.1 solute carrier family 6 member 6 [Homo sapiens]KAI4028455.1 solute carrier family 6 member 6 [Homo sapiens]KAI4028459.1 solute carrier family 6 member 6 [Homo sapiens]PNI73469.1 SLC6A6 isoform 4 [Pan troglodytes]